MGARRSTLQLVLVAIGCLGICLALITIRLLVDGRSALRQGEAAASRGDEDEAVLKLREAARLYVPGSTTTARALDGLEALARRAETAGDLRGARRALEAARSALLGTRSFFTPLGERLSHIDRKLAELQARPDAGGGHASRGAALYLAALAEPRGPAPVWALVGLVGLATWIGAALAFFRRGLDAAIRVRPRPAAVCGACFALGLALFVVGLVLA